MSEPTPDFITPDDCPWLSPLAIFRRLGYTPPPPEAVDDFCLPGRLWELLYAMAARRFYVSSTNHLDDRQLYVWLHANLLPHQTADIPPEARWNTRWDVSEASTGLDSGTECWLRYYATGAEREEWLGENPGAAIPPREPPVADRDRWLPIAPEDPLPDDEEEDFFPAEEDAEDDPLGLGAVDAEIRAERRTQEARAASDNWQRPLDQLRATGAAPIPPAELTEETLPAKLWELLHRLGCRGFFLHHTDHLSELEIYTALWERGLREDALMPGRRTRRAAWHHDFIGSGSEEDTQIWLRYYASPEERAQHQQDWPNTPVPPREARPFQRDWRLPQSPF